MNHLLLVPVLLPLICGALLMTTSRSPINQVRLISCGSVLLLFLAALYLLTQAGSGQIQVYGLGDWPAPFGIVLVLDRLSALMLMVTAVLGVFVTLYAMRGDDLRGGYFHALLQFQLAGINGAFLTGDLFNLFVFFEILLIASYALLLHGLGAARLRAALHYVILNLIGSSLFLISAGLFYGIAGTLNLVDLARFIAQAEGDQLFLLEAAGALLMMVFGLKAAFFPLYFWLPRAYAHATAPVAALFAIMTKIGLYAILRFSTLVFGVSAGGASGLGTGVLWVLALVTVVLSILGAFAANTLTSLLAYLVLVSVGTLLAGIAIGTEEAITAILYYLLHSTWIIAGLFLLADIIAKQRGDLATGLKVGPQLLNPHLLGGTFFVAAIAVAGLPPFSGFFGKVLLLQSVSGSAAWQLWPVILISGLVGVVGLSRAGSMIFWRSNNTLSGAAPLDKTAYFFTVLLLLTSPLLVVFAQPVIAFTEATAQQIMDVPSYLNAMQLKEAL
ncbi:monovalent cation/H+ antiporter subunit D [Denitrificimonas sp. JX-1]|uniref:Monovalent cation/H+ antiporter subunit D n=1 Tax=Denitrificimonas halotolerans TaxID=3098930 RepID=A0ABU5GPC5_9GAMM|nr:monovalent cation/H+ antiporter subunit D [Denitrificimonas sp. JX-1]MDY7218826.1 monovalent cation/H+ antiporter subunit D [Denitrificimonas sp. JX-1]